MAVFDKTEPLVCHMVCEVSCLILIDTILSGDLITHVRQDDWLHASRVASYDTGYQKTILPTGLILLCTCALYTAYPMHCKDVYIDTYWFFDISICIHAYICKFICIYKHIYVYVYIYIYIYTCMYLYIYVFVCIHAYIYICIYVNTHICLRVRARLYVCNGLDMSICIHSILLSWSKAAIVEKYALNVTSIFQNWNDNVGHSLCM